MRKNLKIGMGQMLVQGGMVDENLDRAVRMIKKAAESGCDIVVLPECLDLGWTFPDTKALADTIPGKPSAALCGAANCHGIYVAAGLAERDGRKIYNSAVLISPEGEVLSKHRKINILNIAQDIYSVGNMMSVTETPIGTIGINICADNFPDTFVLGHTLARMGADIILSPSSWAVPPDNSDDNPCREWERSYTALAAYFDIPVIGVSNIGPVMGGVWNGYHCIGNSLAVAAGGKIIAKGRFTSTDEELIIAEPELVSGRKSGTDLKEVLEEKGFFSLFD